jgi:hypothetical protein
MGIKEKILICIIAVAAIFAIPEIMPHFYKRVAWDQYTDEGRRLVQFGDKDKAVDYYKAQVQDVLKAGGSKDPRYIAVLEGLALSYQKQEMFEAPTISSTRRWRHSRSRGFLTVCGLVRCWN